MNLLAEALQRFAQQGREQAYGFQRMSWSASATQAAQATPAFAAGAPLQWEWGCTQLDRCRRGAVWAPDDGDRLDLHFPIEPSEHTQSREVEPVQAWGTAPLLETQLRPHGALAHERVTAAEDEAPAGGTARLHLFHL